MECDEGEAPPPPAGCTVVLLIVIAAVAVVKYAPVWVIVLGCVGIVTCLSVLAAAK